MRERTREVCQKYDVWGFNKMWAQSIYVNGIMLQWEVLRAFHASGCVKWIKNLGVDIFQLSDDFFDVGAGGCQRSTTTHS